MPLLEMARWTLGTCHAARPSVPRMHYYQGQRAAPARAAWGAPSAHPPVHASLMRTALTPPAAPAGLAAQRAGRRRASMQRATPGKSTPGVKAVGGAAAAATGQPSEGPTASQPPPYLGVKRSGGYWQAQIRHRGTDIPLGRHPTAEAAARAHDQAALRIQPPDGPPQLNFPAEEYYAGGAQDRRGGLLPAPEVEAALRRGGVPHRKGKRRGGSSAFVGVNLEKDTGRWRASIKRDGKQLLLGIFDREEDAARAFDQASVRVRSPSEANLNFDWDDYVDGRTGELLPAPRIEAILRGERPAGETKAGKPTSSRFHGVTVREGVTDGTCSAHIRVGGRVVHLGVYPSEEAAAAAWDAAALRARPRESLQLNFDAENYVDGQTGELLPAPLVEAALRGERVPGVTKAGKATRSAFRGVSPSKGKWTARLWHGGRYVHLGYHDSEEEAARAVDQAALRMKPRDQVKLNFPLDSYLDSQTGELLPASDVEARLQTAAGPE